MSAAWTCNDCKQTYDRDFGFKNKCDICEKPLCHPCAEEALRENEEFSNTFTACPECEAKIDAGPTTEELEAEGQLRLIP